MTKIVTCNWTRVKKNACKILSSKAFAYSLILIRRIQRSVGKGRTFIYIFYFLARIFKTRKKEYTVLKMCKSEFYVKSWNPVWCWWHIIKQTFHAFLFNIRNYSPEVINIRYYTKKPWNICFIICHQHQTWSGKIRTNKNVLRILSSI